MTAVEVVSIVLTVGVCAAIACGDPAGPRGRRTMRRGLARVILGTAIRLNGVASRLLDLADWLAPAQQDAQAPGEAGHLQRAPSGGEGAAPVVAAPSPVAMICGCEVLVDREIKVTAELALGHYLSRTSRAKGASA